MSWPETIAVMCAPGTTCSATSAHTCVEATILTASPWVLAELEEDAAPLVAFESVCELGVQETAKQAAAEIESKRRIMCSTIVKMEMFVKYVFV